MKIKKHSNGYYYAHFWTETGDAEMSLRTKDAAEARRLAKDAKIAEQEQAAKVRALTVETFARITVGRKATGTEAFDAWRAWAKTVGLTRNTIARYATYIDLFLRERGYDKRSLAACGDGDVDSFINPADSDIVANTRRNRLCALQSFFSVAAAKGFIARNPTDAVRVKLEGLTLEQKEPKVREPFTDLELALLRKIDDPFWRTFVLLGEHYGFRVGDVAQLERASVRKDTILVWTDKRDKRLELPLDPEVRKHLESLPHLDDTYFFPEQRAVAIDTKLRSVLSTYFGRIIKRLGIEGKNTHNMRHTFATKREGLGDTVDQIREKLGHESTTTTETYIHA